MIDLNKVLNTVIIIIYLDYLMIIRGTESRKLLENA